VSNWHGLMYPLKPGSEDTVRDLFRTSGRPSLEVTDETGQPVGRLLGTLAFVGKQVAIRIIEVDGPLDKISAYIGRQEETHAFQRQLQPYLAPGRDMNSPESIRAFFRDATLKCVLARSDGQDQ
jgi:hypothetical protein